MGPVWHKKQKDLGIIPKGLRGVDKKATWCKSNADGWVYGHGSNRSDASASSIQAG